MTENSIDDVLFSRVYSSLESAGMHVGKAYEAQELMALKGEIKDAESYYESALKNLDEEDCREAYELVNTCMEKCQNAFESEDLQKAREVANEVMGINIDAIEASKKCYKG